MHSSCRAVRIVLLGLRQSCVRSLVILTAGQVDVIDAELLKPWERKRQEYKQRKKVRAESARARPC